MRSGHCGGKRIEGGEVRHGSSGDSCISHDMADHGNDYSDDGDNEGDSMCSESDGLEYEKRDTMLDDTLFGFFRCVGDCVDPICSQITVGYKHVDISKNTVHAILEMPHITFFGNKLCGSEELSEHDVFVCFMAVAISCFVCPNMREYPNCKYLSVLKFLEAVRGYDFSKLVYQCCLESINQFSMLGKVKGRRLRAPVCCNYVLVVHYLDCLDFGKQNVEQTIPRIKGVVLADVLYRKPQSPIFAPVSLNFRENVHNRFGSILRADIDNFIHLWELIISPEHDFGSFKAMYPHVPKQQTLVDCGVFVMKCMEIWKPYLDLRKLFSDTDILNIRIQYAIKLYFHSENEADLSLVTDLYG
ncbi:hypothetical protein ACQ4PT_034841 [Festuca glaucescens]